MLDGFQQDFEQLSITAVFVEQAKLDDINYDLGSFKLTFDHIEDKLYSTLCSLQNLIKNLGSSVNSNVTRDVMPEELKSISNNTLQRYSRDFITLKDAFLFYSKLLDKFIFIL